MRRFALPLAALVVFAACSGDSGGSALTLPDTTTTALPVQTVATTDAPPVTDAVTTEPSTSVASTSTTTTIEEVPLTVVESSTTVIPADVDETFAEAFAVYQEAWQARQDGARNPGDDSVRRRIRDLYDDPFLTELLDGLEVQEAGTLRKVVSEDREASSVTFEEGIVSVEDGSLAQFAVCEILTDRTVDTATGEVVFDAVVAYSNEVRMSKVAGEWRVAEEVTVVKQEGTSCAD